MRWSASPGGGNGNGLIPFLSLTLGIVGDSWRAPLRSPWLEQLHARTCRLPVEGDGVLAFRGMAGALNETVGKIRAAGVELSKGLPDDSRALNRQFFASQQGLQDPLNLALFKTVGNLQHPHQFRDDDKGQKSG